jgi:hypothetical protein
METPAEYFDRTKASQWQALKMLGHSHARCEELRKIHERSREGVPRSSALENPMSADSRSRQDI